MSDSAGDKGNGGVAPGPKKFVFRMPAPPPPLRGGLRQSITPPRFPFPSACPIGQPQAPPQQPQYQNSTVIQQERPPTSSPSPLRSNSFFLSPPAPAPLRQPLPSPQRLQSSALPGSSFFLPPPISIDQPVSPLQKIPVIQPPPPPQRQQKAEIQIQNTTSHIYNGNNDKIKLPTISFAEDDDFDDDDEDFCQIIEPPPQLTSNAQPGSSYSSTKTNIVATNGVSRPLLAPDTQSKEPPVRKPKYPSGGNDEDWELTKLKYQQYSKHDPWVNKHPLQKLVPLLYQNTASSVYLTLDKRLEISHSALSYVQELIKSSEFAENGSSSSSSISIEINNVLKAFEAMFKRFLLAKLNANHSQLGELERLGERIWNCHIEGEINFTGTSILNLLLKYSTNYLEDSLAKLMKSVLISVQAQQQVIQQKNPNPNDSLLVPSATTNELISSSNEFSILLRLCQSNPSNFQLIFTTIYNVWRAAHYHGHIIYFMRRFLDELNKELSTSTCPTAMLSMYPTIFHPILYFVASIEEFGSSSSAGHIVVSIQNILSNHSEIQSHLLGLMNALYASSSSNVCDDDDEYENNYITFFLATNSILSTLICETYESDVLSCRNYPFLWSVVEKCCRSRN